MAGALEMRGEGQAQGSRGTCRPHEAERDEHKGAEAQGGCPPLTGPGEEPHLYKS